MNPHLKIDYADVYKKTQIGWQFLVVVWIIVAIADRAGILSNILAGILVFVLFIFGSLTIAVDKTFVWMQFGIGFIRMKFKLEEIESCLTVQNPWYYSLGIFPMINGWSFSIQNNRKSCVSIFGVTSAKRADAIELFFPVYAITVQHSRRSKSCAFSETNQLAYMGNHNCPFICCLDQSYTFFR